MSRSCEVRNSTFEILTIIGFFNTRALGDEDNKTYFLLYLDDDALNYWADKLRL